MIGRGGLKVLIIGGYGTFGGRLVRLLADEVRLTLMVAGRSSEAAASFCAAWRSNALLQPTVFDRNGDLARQLGALCPDLVIDASGPFQTLGASPYRVVEACLSLRIPYVDLADASAFVTGIRHHDAAARTNGIFVLSGLSTFPALTFAVLRTLTAGLDHVDAITAGVAPSPHARVGLSVIQAIASYAGRPIPMLRQGRGTTGFGLTESRRFTIAPPGCVPLASRLFSLVDVPDLTLAASVFPGLDSIWVGAGTHPALLHRGLVGLAWLVRLSLLPRLAPLASAFHRAKTWLRWGEDRGGLMIEVLGRMGSGAPVSRSWHLIAEGENGPFIPCLPAEALIRSMLDGKAPPSGARPATDVLRLDDLEQLFAKHDIVTGFREQDTATLTLPLYRRILGEVWAGLPASVQRLHSMTGSCRYAGLASVERGEGRLAGLIATLIGFPTAGVDVPVSVRFGMRGGLELWQRDFAGRRFSSTQGEGSGRWRHLVVERFGPAAVGLALKVEGRRLYLIVRRWSLFGVPLPLRFAPGGKTFEAETDGRFAFHVEITTPLTGLIVRYQGWLQPVP